MRPRPSFVAQSRPVAPDIKAEPTLPSSAPEGKSLFVNLTRAVIPPGAVEERASWMAWSSGFAGGVGPPPPAATAIAATPAASANTAAMSRMRRCVGSIRRSLTAILSTILPSL